jgi:hypothetical protein
VGMICEVTYARRSEGMDYESDLRVPKPRLPVFSQREIASGEEAKDHVPVSGDRRAFVVRNYGMRNGSRDPRRFLSTDDNPSPPHFSLLCTFPRCILRGQAFSTRNLQKRA